MSGRTPRRTGRGLTAIGVLLLSLWGPARAGAVASARARGRAVTAERSAGAADVSCSTRTARAPLLRRRLGWSRTPTQPFGVAITSNGRFVFAGLSNDVGVYVRRGDRLLRRATITLPEGALGVALVPSGRYLLVADGTGGAYVLDVAAAERGSKSAVLGQRMPS